MDYMTELIEKCFGIFHCETAPARARTTTVPSHDSKELDRFYKVLIPLNKITKIVDILLQKINLLLRMF